MANLVQKVNGNELVVSTFDIAEQTNNDHASVVKLVRNYQADFESFGRVGFEIAPFETAGGTQKREVALLNENQSALLLTYMRNSDIVRSFKVRLIKEFSELKAPSPMTLEQLLQQNVMMIQDLSQKVLTLETTIQQDKPMTDFGKAVSASDTAVLIGDWIKVLAEQGMKVGRNKAFDWLREKGYLMRSNMPYQQYVNQGLFEVKESLVSTPKGQKVNFTTLLTGKGQVYFASKLKTDLVGV